MTTIHVTSFAPPTQVAHGFKRGDRVNFRADSHTPWSRGVWTVSEAGSNGDLFIKGGTFGQPVPALHVAERLRMAVR